MEELDRDLWDQAAAGSDAAFATLFERHASSVYNYCFRRRGNWAEAEDLTSATFLEAWRRRDEVLLANDSIRPWLLGVATNLFRNDIRSRRRRETALQRLAVIEERPQDGLADDVAGRIDDERRMKAVLEQLKKLPPEHQEVVALVVWSELTYEEAAIALGVPAGTVKSRLSRARRGLMELEGDNGHDTQDRDALARASTTQPREVEG
ncbi:MAG TPA: RNA polymerase sigma factor [Actinomycetota bacterium]|nr:RNA polymerase sigma factor [Actinomycetota bacterium]